MEGSITEHMQMPNSNEHHRTIVQIVFGYEPNKPAAGTTGTLFFLLSVALFLRLVRRKDWWGLCLPIGVFCYCAGFFLRIAVDSSPNNEGLFIVMQLLLVTSPAAFLAFNYIVYGRLVRHRVGNQYSFIRPQIVARVFVASDLATFMIQGAGGGIENSEGSASLGSRILLIGLITQTLSYLVFIVLLLDSHRRIANDLVFVSRHAFIRMFHLLYASSLFIVMRGVYRVVEFAQGHMGFLVTHEVFFYALDSLPLLLATVIYALFWPGKYISPVPAEEMLSLQKRSNPYNVPHQDVHNLATEDD